MQKAVLEIYKDYGEEIVLKYCTKLSASEIPTKNDCCDRNQDGTTNNDCCNIWEHFLVAAGTAIRCDSDGPMEGFYDCVQQRVCNNC